MTLKAATKLGRKLLDYCGHPDWKIQWSTAAPSECWEESKKLMMWKGILGKPYWYVKEDFLHEIAHIHWYNPTASAEDNHGIMFFTKLGALYIKCAKIKPEEDVHK